MKWGQMPRKLYLVRNKETRNTKNYNPLVNMPGKVTHRSQKYFQHVPINFQKNAPWSFDYNILLVCRIEVHFNLKDGGGSNWPKLEIFKTNGRLAIF